MIRYILLLAFVFVAACTHKPTTSPVFGEAYHSTLPPLQVAPNNTIERLAFGSCANQDEPQPLWSTILKSDPDLFVFMGDNVYASSPSQHPMSDQYRKLDQIPEYRALREKVPFLATWDDHDFGQKDGGADFTDKDGAREVFLNYWAVAKNSLIPEQKGLYHAKIFGPQEQRVQVILLDTRYFRTPLRPRPLKDGAFQGFASSDAADDTILGEAQWQWLEAELQKPARLRFIVSSIQVIADEHPFEKWGNFPAERRRLFELLKKSKARNVILLSGDRHMGMIAKLNLPNYGSLYEVTASSINRPNTYSTKDSKYVGPVTSAVNYGLALIDWKKRQVRLEIRDIENQPTSSAIIPLR